MPLVHPSHGRIRKATRRYVREMQGSDSAATNQRIYSTSLNILCRTACTEPDHDQLAIPSLTR